MTATVNTYRERRLAKAERLREWADKREVRDSTPSGSEQALSQIPFGQPILVGHHSERRHRNAVEKADNSMRRRMDSLDKAESFNSRADNIEAAAERAIYSDDEDAVEKLRQRIEELEARRAAIKARNAEYRKANKEELKTLTPYQRDQALPHAGYELTNLGGNISRNRKRLAQLDAQAVATENGSRSYGKQMSARYAGTCAECGAPVEVGESMTYYRQTREVVCASC